MPVDELSAVFAALADPTRRALLTRLEAGDASVAHKTGNIATVDHDGSTYYFCSQDCADEFREGPDDYVKA